MGTKAGKNEYLVDPARLEQIGLAVEDVGAGLQGYRQYQIEVVGLNIKRPKAANEEFFVVVKGIDSEGTPCVAFHAAFSLGELFMGLHARLRNGSLKWRVDEFMK
jgi:hypothetical protein